MRPVLDRMAIFRALFPDRAAAGAVAARWRAARDADPELMGDLIRLGKVLQLQDKIVDADGTALDRTDAAEVMYDRGRRDLAVELVALMGVTDRELAQMMEGRHEGE